MLAIAGMSSERAMMDACVMALPRVVQNPSLARPRRRGQLLCREYGVWGRFDPARFRPRQEPKHPLAHVTKVGGPCGQEEIDHRVELAHQGIDRPLPSEGGVSH
jgi:hypothetical protein